MTSTKDTITKWVIICTSILWICVGFWGVYHCFQIADYGRLSSTATTGLYSIESSNNLNQVLGLNVLQASMVFVACIISSIFVLYSVLLINPTKSKTTRTKTVTTTA